MERGELNSVHGRLMVSMLILQDISVVVMIIIVPFIGGTMTNLPLALVTSIGTAMLFIVIAIVTGLWILPWLLGRIGGVRSRELFLLTVLVVCLGAALATQIFGLSLVFGAFLIGMVLRETKFAHQALAEITPLRDIFATLFFVSLGMLLNPTFVLDHWALVLGAVGLIIFIKVVVVYGIIRFFGYGGRIALIAGAGLFQIGEFSFILAQGALNTRLISDDFYSLILASAIITMLLTPISISLVSRLYPKLGKRALTRDIVPVSALPQVANWVVVAGYGRIGQNIVEGLQSAGMPYIVLDIDPERVSDAQKKGRPCIYGDASNANVLQQAELHKATALVVTYPDPLAVIATVKNAREINPKLSVVARVHRANEAEQLGRMGGVELISPEYEASREFLKKIATTAGIDKELETKAILQQDEFAESSSEE